MKIKKIYICFEGVLADFDGRVKELWGITSPDQDCTIDDYYRFWEKIRNESHFYEGLVPLPGSLEMFANLYEKYRSICEIVSERHFIYSVKQGECVYAEGENELADKTAWVQKCLPGNIKTDWSFSGSINCKDPGYILIDSREEKITEWQNKGGTGIVFRSSQETLKKLEDIEEEFRRANKKMSADKLKELVLECKQVVKKIESIYKRGLLTDDEARNEKIQIAGKAWDTIKKFCDKEEIDFDGEKDNAYQTLFASVGITVKKVPVRYYPTVELMTGSLYYFYGLVNEESLFNDSDPIGKMFKFKKTMKIGEENILLDYFFKVKREEFEVEKLAHWEGWKCYEGTGKLEGYRWADASIHVREYNGKIQSVTIQKTYFRYSEPIWKMRSAYPAKGHRWIGIYEEIPDNLEISESEFYFDETLDPPRGRHYKEYGILAYDDTEEIVILGIKDPDAEIVEIPREINGKPVTALDERCFANCSETLKKVIFPDTLKEIGDYAFENCKNLEKPVIPASVTKIGKGIV